MQEILSNLNEISVLWPSIVLLGLVIGILSGLLGTGGGFLMTPMLKILFCIPYSIAVGSSLCAIVATSISGVIRHFKYRHVNVKLGLFLISGSIIGVELGAKLLTYIRDVENFRIFGHTISAIDFIMNCCYIILLLLISILMFREANRYKKAANSNSQPAIKDLATPLVRDLSTPLIRDLATYKINFFLFPLNKIVQRNLSKENTDSINILALVISGFLVGVLAGFLGVGGGFVMTPVLICIFGIPAAVAVGTDLFQIAITSVFGTVSHTFKGNVNFVLVGLILCGSLVGSQIGASLTEKIRGRKIRLYFAYLLLVSSLIIIIELLSELISL